MRATISIADYPNGGWGLGCTTADAKRVDDWCVGEVAVGVSLGDEDSLRRRVVRNASEGDPVSCGSCRKREFPARVRSQAPWLLRAGLDGRQIVRIVSQY